MSLRAKNQDPKQKVVHTADSNHAARNVVEKEYVNIKGNRVVVLTVAAVLTVNTRKENHIAWNVMVSLYAPTKN